MESKKECSSYERGLNHISLSAVCLVSRRGHRTCSLWAWFSSSFSRKENIRVWTKKNVKKLYRTGYQGEYVTNTGYRTGLLIKQKITNLFCIDLFLYNPGLRHQGGGSGGHVPPNQNVGWDIVSFVPPQKKTVQFSPLVI